MGVRKNITQHTVSFKWKIIVKLKKYSVQLLQIMRILKYRPDGTLKRQKSKIYRKI